MKKTLGIVAAVLLLSAGVFAQPESPYSNEPIRSLMQNALDHNLQIFQKNNSDRDYLNAFLPLWKQTLSRLFSQDATEGRLEAFFGANSDLLKKAEASFQKLKVPSSFKEFQDVFTQGMDQLSDWCLDMRDRIHYSKTDYQRKAYLKRIEAFRSEWYDTFFGDALEEITNEMSIFLASHWEDALTPAQSAALKKDKALRQYLARDQKINLAHLKAAGKITQNVREDRGKNKGEEDPAEYADSLNKELKDLNKTLADLKKLNPPPAFKDFHNDQIALLNAKIWGAQLELQIRNAIRNNAPDETVQDLQNSKNENENETQNLKAATDKAYLDALKTLP